MRLGILCVGRLKAGPERELYARYAERVRMMRNIGFDGLELREVDESRARAAPERIAGEGRALLTLLGAADGLVAFDERGTAASSLDFATFLTRERDGGRRALWFAIGGAEGLDECVRERALHVFSFGMMTLPHQLVRVLVAEQIYRALTIVTGHPYHRA